MIPLIHGQFLEVSSQVELLKDQSPSFSSSNQSSGCSHTRTRTYCNMSRCTNRILYRAKLLAKTSEISTSHNNNGCAAAYVASVHLKTINFFNFTIIIPQFYFKRKPQSPKAMSVRACGQHCNKICERSVICDRTN